MDTQTASDIVTHGNQYTTRQRQIAWMTLRADGSPEELIHLLTLPGRKDVRSLTAKEMIRMAEEQDMLGAVVGVLAQTILSQKGRPLDMAGWALAQLVSRHNCYTGSKR